MVTMSPAATPCCSLLVRMLVRKICGADAGVRSMELLREKLRMPNLHFNRWRAQQIREEVACQRRWHEKEQPKQELAMREDEFVES